MRTLVPYGADTVPADWGIRRAARLAFPGPAELAADPVHGERLRVYLTDLLGPHGLRLDDGPPARGGQSYGEMAEELIRRTVPPGESVDLLVLAYSVPDIAPGRATTTRLSHVCPGGPMAFAVTDQGSAAAFTALRLIRAYAAGAGLRRALLLIVEQQALPYDPGVPVTLPDAAYGVALLLGEPAAGERPMVPCLVATHARPSPVAAAAPLRVPAAHPAALDAEPEPEPGARAFEAALAAELAAGAGPVTAVLAAGLADRAPALAAGGGSVRVVDIGRPLTGVWWELAGEPADPPPGARRLILADRDPVHGDLSLAVFDTAATGRPR
ncbi:hypothetical protein [Streptomyces sp. NPDC049040]|uniref:hypothetical protein n=1 Tax=Streptomyces sp. NPDC049040 TaxID=3365593 RepID=UPI003721AA71